MSRTLDILELKTLPGNSRSGMLPPAMISLELLGPGSVSVCRTLPFLRLTGTGLGIGVRSWKIGRWLGRGTPRDSSTCGNFRVFVRGTHNPLVPGSSPGGPTTFQYFSLPYGIGTKGPSIARSPLVHGRAPRESWGYGVGTMGSGDVGTGNVRSVSEKPHCHSHA
jgi:hypothetical protein